MREAVSGGYNRRLSVVGACLLILIIVGSAGTFPASPSPQPAARMKVRGPEVIIAAEGQTHYFQNLLPHCLAYTLDGEWEFAVQEAALRKPDGRGFVGVLLRNAASFPGSSEAEPVARAVAYYQADTSKDWGGSVPSTVEPFPGARPGAVLLQFEPIVVTQEIAARMPGPARPKIGQRFNVQKRVIAPLLPGVLVVVSASDATHARQVLDTLEISEQPQCWRNVIRERFPSIRP